MQRLVKFNSAATSVGTYAAINAYSSTLNPASGVQVNVPSLLASGTLIATAGVGVTAGAVQPFMLGPDGNYYPLATPTTLTAAGFGFLFQMNSPVAGLAIQITTAIVGGSVYLATSAIML